MKDPDSFITSEGITVIRLAGKVSLAQGIEQVTLAISRARAQGVRRLLVNTSGLTGFDPPRVGTRYFFAHEWARAAGGQLSIAMVARPEMIDPQKFGIAVANSAGLRSDVFVTEEEALAWLRNLG
jgi:hypothetical protein